jgi:hypothetical protein
LQHSPELEEAVRVDRTSQVRAWRQLLQLLNHPNFGNPVSNNLSSSFGHITTAAVSPTTPYGSFALAAEGRRIVQVIVKISF